VTGAERRAAPVALLALVAARRAAERAQDELHAAAAAARAAGHTWAEIGAALGTTRQAAFKRFGAPLDPRDGRPTTPSPTDGLDLATEELFRRLDAGDYDHLRALMPDEVAAALTRDLVLGTWAAAVREAGRLERCEATRLELPDGSPVEEGVPVLGAVVAATGLVCEAGSWLGRVAWDEARVVGLLVVPPGTSGLPF
jgi:hypothetical protein